MALEFSNKEDTRDVPAIFFDLDHTLIYPKSGKFYGKNNEFTYGKYVEKYLDLFSERYAIYVITNQARYNEKVEERINNFIDHFTFPIKVLVATQKDRYRKPGIGLLDFVNHKITDESFHCGDAAGRSSDFSDDDYWFSQHAKIRFYTPEEIFRPGTDPLSFKTGPLKLVKSPKIDDILIKKLEKIYEKYNYITLVGLPGVGKTYLRNWFINRFGENNVGYNNNDEKVKSDKNKRFIINDNTNLKDSKERINVIYFDLDYLGFEESKRGITYRVTINNGENIPDVAIRTMIKNFVEPKNPILTIRSRPILTTEFPPYLIMN